MRYDDHRNPHLGPQARETLNRVGICLKSVWHTVGPQLRVSLNPTCRELPKQSPHKKLE